MKIIDCTEHHLAYFTQIRIYKVHMSYKQETMLVITDRELSFQPRNFAMVFANVRWNHGFGKH